MQYSILFALYDSRKVIYKSFFLLPSTQKKPAENSGGLFKLLTCLMPKAVNSSIFEVPALKDRAKRMQLMNYSG